MKVHWLEQNVADVPAENDWLCAREQERLEGFRVPKRRTDWRMGRWTAKHAVAAFLGLSHSRAGLSEIEIRPTAFGVPAVFIADEPAEVCISISHRAAWAICAVAPRGSMLGCDLELIEPRSDAFIADYFTPTEQELIRRASSSERDALANLYWSAKESALKALGVGLTVESHLAEVTYIEFPDAKDPSQAVAWKCLRVAHSGDQVLNGWWQRTGMLLRTMVASPEPTQPCVIEP